MKSLVPGFLALLGAWLLSPRLQVEHPPVVGPPGGTTATASAADDQSTQPAPTNKGGRTMR